MMHLTFVWVVLLLGMNYHLVRCTENAKLGPMPTSFVSAESCPESCPLKGKGCYAGEGRINMTWLRVTRGTVGKPFGEFLKDVRQIERGRIWRHAATGDLPGHGDHLDGAMLDQLADANRGKMGYAYTHKPPTESNLKAIRKAVAAGFIINLSADSLGEADQLTAHGLPVVALVKRDTPDRFTTPQGRPGIVCPAQTKGIQCFQCRLCARGHTSDWQRPIIGFRAHGNRAAKVEEIIEANS